MSGSTAWCTFDCRLTWTMQLVFGLEQGSRAKKWHSGIKWQLSLVGTSEQNTAIWFLGTVHTLLMIVPCLFILKSTCSPVYFHMGMASRKPTTLRRHAEGLHHCIIWGRLHPRLSCHFGISGDNLDGKEWLAVAIVSISSHGDVANSSSYIVWILLFFYYL